MNGQSGELRPFVLLGLGGWLFEAFLNSVDSLVDVVDDSALLIERTLQRQFAGLGLLELLAKIGIGLLETLPMTGLVAESIADDETEGGR
jgi:hypothetical protein